MENQVKEKLKQLGNHILTASRNELYLSMRFLDTALSSLTYEMSLSTNFMGTDGAYIYYNPRFLAEKYEVNPISINRAYLHMILHCLFRHVYQQEERVKEEWDLACDIAVESILDDFTYRSVAVVVTDRREEVYQKLGAKLKVLTAEGIYKELMDHPLTFTEYSSLCKEFTVDDHSFWDAKKKDESEDESENESSDNNSSNETTQMDMKKWEKVTQMMKTNLETFSKRIGGEAPSLLKSLEIECRERYNYKDFLRKFAVIREVMKVDEDAFDYVLYHYGLTNYKNMPLIEPLEYKETHEISEFVIVIDTSGSCSNELIQSFLAATYDILKETESFSKKVMIRIIQCDYKVQYDQVITNLEDLETYMQTMTIKGHGGTDFRPAFAYVNELIEKKVLKDLKGMIYFTDGYGIYPKKRPDYEVAFVFMQEDYIDVGVVPWAMKIVIGKDEIYGL